MRHVPTDDFDRGDLEEMKPAPWMVEALALNPSYCSWGPGEDYMPSPDTEGQSQWGSSLRHPSWAAFGPWTLDELNVCANFYFRLDRESRDCKTCGSTGYHPDARWIVDSFYRHSSPFLADTSLDVTIRRGLRERLGMQVRDRIAQAGFPDEVLLSRYGAAFRAFCEAMRDGDGAWSDKITEDEAAALVEAGRGRIDGLTTAADFNAANAPDRRGFGHDGINAGILYRRRCERLGVPFTCESCDGKGYQFTASTGRLGLVLWMLHPRKGASRGVEIQSLDEDDLPKIRAWLAEAARQNAERFAAVMVSA